MVGWRSRVGGGRRKMRALLLTCVFCVGLPWRGSAG